MYQIKHPFIVKTVLSTDWITPFILIELREYTVAGAVHHSQMETTGAEPLS
jgi:hypothetical protein